MPDAKAVPIKQSALDVLFHRAATDPTFSQRLRIAGPTLAERLGLDATASRKLLAAPLLQQPSLHVNAVAAFAAGRAATLVRAVSLTQLSRDINLIEAVVAASGDWTTPDGVKVHRLPDGSQQQTFPDGSVAVVAPDGTYVETWPDGTVRHDHGNGTWDETNPDGTTVHHNADGSDDIVTPDGTRSHVSPDGAQETHGADGSTLFIGADGAFAYTTAAGQTYNGIGFPDGHRMYVQPDGSVVFEYHNGPYSMTCVVSTDGTATTTLMHGGWVQVKPSGALHVQTSDGPTLDVDTNGRISGKLRFGDEADWLDGTYTRPVHAAIVESAPTRTGSDLAAPVVGANGVAVHVSSHGVRTLSSPHGNSAAVWPNHVSFQLMPSGVVKAQFEGNQSVVIFGDEIHFVDPQGRFYAVHAAGGYWGTGAGPGDESAYEHYYEHPPPIP